MNNKVENLYRNLIKIKITSIMPQIYNPTLIYTNFPAFIK